MKGRFTGDPKLTGPLLGGQPLNLSWTSDKLKVLVGLIGPGDVEEDNWHAVENVLQYWKGWTLSYRGRALVVNALALSRIWYVASIFGVPA